MATLTGYLWPQIQVTIHQQHRIIGIIQRKREQSLGADRLQETLQQQLWGRHKRDHLLAIRRPYVISHADRGGASVFGAVVFVH